MRLRPIPAPGWAYEQAESQGFRLEELLTRHGITIAPGSALEGAVLKASRLADRVRTDHLATTTEDIRDTYRVSVGLHGLASQILAVADHPDFHKLIPHLHLLNEGESLQNMVSPGYDQATNKVFELFVATQVMHCGTNLEIDSPASAGGNNPDLLFTANGKRWGIACKVFHGRTPQGFHDLLAKGIDQIEKSPAEVGVVAMSMKNILDHDAYWPLADIQGAPSLPGAWLDPQTPFQMVTNDMLGHGRRLAEHLPAGHLEAMFRSKKAVPGVLLWGSTVSGAVIHGRPTPVNVRQTIFLAVGHVSAEDRAVLECLHWAAFPEVSDRGASPLEIDDVPPLNVG